jgi:hypothetical protein
VGIGSADAAAYPPLIHPHRSPQTIADCVKRTGVEVVQEYI